MEDEGEYRKQAIEFMGDEGEKSMEDERYCRKGYKEVAIENEKRDKRS